MARKMQRNCTQRCSLPRRKNGNIRSYRFFSYIPLEEAERGEPMALLYCECGHVIWSELWWKGTGQVLLYFDDLETSETYAERVTHCPGCGLQLRNGLLKPTSGEYSSGAQRSRETV